MVVLVGLLLAALVPLVVAGLRPPERAPDVIGAVTRPLDLATVPTSALGLTGATRLGGDGAVVRALRAVRDWHVLQAEATLGAGRSFLGRLRDRAGDVIDDPLGGLRDVGEVTDWITDPLGTARAQFGDIASYVDELRRLPPREAFLRLTSDAGGASADVVVARLSGRARTALLERWRAGVGPAPAAPPAGR